MITVKGFAAQSPKHDLAPYQFQRRAVGAHDVEIEIHYCGVCHSDLHQARDEWGGGIFPMVPGHEIAGVVAKVGTAVSRYKVGDRVGVGCLVDSCRDCHNCHDGLQQFCENGMVGTYNSRERDGKTPTYGGYSTQIVVDENYVLRFPDNISLDQGAPLLCAGITTYSPLKHWKAGPGKKVAVLGLGGLGHMAVKLARAMGADVTVLSQTMRKAEDAKRLGAHEFYATSDEETFRQLRGRFDLILNTISVELDMARYLNLLARDGAMVLLGVPSKASEVHAFDLIQNRRSLAGSLIGGIEETQEMLDFCGQHGIAADIELIPIQKINEAFARMLAGDVRYRFVIDTKSLA